MGWTSHRMVASTWSSRPASASRNSPSTSGRTVDMKRALAIAAVIAALFPFRGTAGAATAPVAVRIVGGSGHAGLYGWGAATLSDGSVLISDYWNYRVQHYNKDGTLR